MSGKDASLGFPAEGYKAELSDKLFEEILLS